MISNMDQLRSEYTQLASNAHLQCDVVMGGTFNARVALIGEAPGPEEVKKGLPFVGGSGQFMFKTLSQEGYKRGDFYITNVAKRQLTTEDREQKARINANEKAHWFELIKWEIAQLPHVEVIVLLGGLALEALTSNRGILNWRGSVLEAQIAGRTYQCIICVNPAYCFQDQLHKIFFRFDLHKIKKVLEGQWKPHPITAHYNLSVPDVMKWIDHFDGSDAPISLDIETPDRTTTSCIGLANSAHEGVCINFHNDSESVYSLADEIKIRQRLAKFIRNPTNKFIMQNGVFDSEWLWYKDRLPVHGVYFDTLLAHHTLYPAFPHDLGFLCTQYTTHPYYKDEKSDWSKTGDINTFWEYNVKDTCITFECQRKLMHELREHKLDEFFFNHVMRLQPELVYMNIMGVKCDTDVKERITDDLRDRVQTLRRRFIEQVRLCTGDESAEVSPGSPAQVGKLLFRDLRLVGRGTSTGKPNLQRIKKHARTTIDVRELIVRLEEFRREEKFRSTYAESRVDEDDRLRTEYKQFGTVSAPGRLSSSQTPWGTGMNLQNQSKKEYEFGDNESISSLAFFVADHGYNFVYFDLSQAEARYVGWDARIESWIEQFERARVDKGYDCHRALASELWGIPYEQVPHKDNDESGNPTKRYVAKRCRHGLNYRMGPDRLAEVTGLTFQEAATAYRLYHQHTPELRRWWRSLENQVYATKCLFNSYGRRLRFFGKLTPELLEPLVAFRPQSSIGDHVTRSIYMSHDDPDWPIRDARVALNIHDANIALVRRGLEHDVARILKRHAEHPIVVHADMLPMIIPADFKMGSFESEAKWSELKGVDL